LKAASKRLLANYFMWHIALEYKDFLTETIRKRYLQYSGVIREVPRWKECLDVVTKDFQQVTTTLYVRKHFNQESKKVALDIVNSIKDQFGQVLKNVPWMDTETRKAALEKVEDMRTYLAYPDKLSNEYLIEYHRELEIDQTKFLESKLNWDKANIDWGFGRRRRTVS
jgi:neprilysin